MAKQEPSMDQWLQEAKKAECASKCGMFLVHNGIVRESAKKEVRQNAEGLPRVKSVKFSYDEKGLAQAESEALTWPGVYYVRTWLNEGEIEVGGSLMYVMIGADIRPRCIDALNKLVGHIKDNLVVEEEVYCD